MLFSLSLVMPAVLHVIIKYHTHYINDRTNTLLLIVELSFIVTPVDTKHESYPHLQTPQFCFRKVLFLVFISILFYLYSTKA